MENNDVVQGQLLCLQSRDKSDWIESARTILNGTERLRAAQSIFNVRDFQARKESQLPPRDYTAVFTRYVPMEFFPIQEFR